MTKILYHGSQTHFYHIWYVCKLTSLQTASNVLKKKNNLYICLLILFLKIKKIKREIFTIEKVGKR